MNPTTTTQYDVCVIGAGFSGMYMLKKLRELGFHTHVFEKGDDVGGTWYWNRYPGARCDVESLFYCYSFDDALQQEWTWSERYPTQPEILAYCRHVADRYDLRPDISFNATVESAVYDEPSGRWHLRTDTGEHVRARWVITAVGCLSASRVPDFPGLEDFHGEWFHTGQWPHQPVDFTGKRVGVIGTGSSGIQAIPVVAQTAHHVTVFQRTPNFSIPAHNHPLDNAAQDWVKAEYAKLRAEARVSASGTLTYPSGKNALEMSKAERRAELDKRWAYGGAAFLAAFEDTMVSEAANEVSAGYVQDRIREIVEDPVVAEKLRPHDHPLGSKRICIDTGYYETYNRDNVQLVDVRTDPLERITQDGLRAGGVDYALDTLVFATGFDAMTGPLTRISINGVDGRSLADVWAEGPRTYLGLGVPGFPNLFTITGPGSPSVLSNMIVSIEQHVEWIADHLDYLRRNGYAKSEADPDAAIQWTEHVDDVAGHTLYLQANSWYLGANVPGKPRVFMPYAGGVGIYRQICDDVARNKYKGFRLSR